MRDCTQVMNSPLDADPSKFQDRSWIGAPYTVNGTVVAALVEEEYWGTKHPGQCPSMDYFKCWYNAVTLAMSNDGGRTFTQAAPPGHLVASSPYQYVPDDGPSGVFLPSNIIFSPTNGYYYSLVMVQEYRAQHRGVCLMRTPDLSQPGAWRAWDGTGYNTRFANPYTETFDPVDHVCQPIDYADINMMTSSLTYSTYLNKFVLVGTSGTEFATGTEQPGFYYSTSSDLINWTQAKLLVPGEMLWTHTCGDADPILYPSLLDPNSPSRNFETIGRTADLFLTQFHYGYNSGGCWMALDRDLVRIPIEFNKPPDCSAVQATPDYLPSQNRKLFPVTVSGASEPDGEYVTTRITAVRQNQPVRGPGDASSPDAVRGKPLNQVLLRAEHSASGGRVYRLSVTATDTKGGTCSSTETVSIPRGTPDPGGQGYDSFAGG